MPSALQFPWNCPICQWA